MIGKPKYTIRQAVEFTVSEKTVKGEIWIIDKYGTFEQNEEVSYDIFSPEENMLYKHIRESLVTPVEKSAADFKEF